MILIQNRDAAVRGTTAILQFMFGAYGAYALSYLTVFTELLPTGKLIPRYAAAAGQSRDNKFRKQFLAELGAPVPTGRQFQKGCDALFALFVVPLTEEELVLGRTLLREKLSPFQVEHIERHFQRPLSTVSVAEMLKELPALRKRHVTLNIVDGAELLLS